ncbi:MAG: hypothetical protein QNJ41_24730 [Xenococcaceae cyanobacterium MO_188.B32]|nr:hypothetical protein [Xenococcaceae cyanobacterium MO_188.B32]
MSSKLKMGGEKTSQNEQIIQRFSMYIYFRDDFSKTRTTLVQEYNNFLKEFMAYLIQQEPNASEEYWSRFFLKSIVTSTHTYSSILFNRFPLSGLYLLIISSELCQKLLISYLQLICFYAAKQISNQLKQSPNFKLHYSLEDCFVIACEASLKPGKLLRNFDFCGNFPLYGYARKTLNRTITNQVVKDFKIRSIKLSDYGLLNSLTLTQLERYLKFYGISSRDIFQYRLVCQIFQELFLEFFPPNLKGKTNQKSINCLSRTQLEQISLVYNQRLPKIETAIEPSNSEEIQKKLAICIKAARTALQRKFVSIEEPNLMLKLVNYEPDRLIEAEKEIHLEELKTTILNSFYSLEGDVQKNLLLWLGLEINQIDFVSILDLQKQYQVTRYFQKHQKNILKQVIRVFTSKYSAENLNIERLNRLCLDNLEYIKEYLQYFCKEYIGNILLIIIKKNFSSTEQEILIQYYTENYFQGKKEEQIHERLKNLFRASIEHELKINLSRFNSTEKYLNKFIKKWIEQNTALIY